MKASLKNITRKVKSKKLPNGKYDGLWGGYVVNFSILDKQYRAETVDIGIRGMNIPCVVTVKDGNITVDTKE